MSNELVEKNEHRKLLEGFQGRINAKPNDNEIKKRPDAGNVLYLPISYIEMSLDEFYFGLWETKDFRWQVAGNEIIGSIILRVFHPVANQWIERTGASATMIRLQKGAAVTDISSKIFNAFEMDFPHLKADCIVNAAKSLGVAFGRDLNRKDRDFYQPIITNAENRARLLNATVNNSGDTIGATELHEDWTEPVKNAKTKEALAELWEQNKDQLGEGTEERVLYRDLILQRGKELGIKTEKQ